MDFVTTTIVIVIVMIIINSITPSTSTSTSINNISNSGSGSNVIPPNASTPCTKCVATHFYEPDGQCSSIVR